MVKIRVFIPHLELKSVFENVVKKLPVYENVTIETTYIFGTPEKLAENMDADILVARGMTSDVLHDLFPLKHMIKIQFSSFDILDALVQCRALAGRNIALFLHHIEISYLKDLEDLCGAKIRVYDVTDEHSTEEAIKKAIADGADTFVGAGTMCGICDKLGLRRVHIHTKQEVVEAAMMEALSTARTINQERNRASLVNTMLNNSEDSIIAVDQHRCIQAINNQAYRTLQLSTIGDVKGLQASSLIKSPQWMEILENNSEKEKVLRIHDKDYLVHFKPLQNDEEAGALIFVKNTDRIIEEESKIRRVLAEKGLTAKYTFKDILGKSEAIHGDIQKADRYSKVNSNVLIIGETGTGKELFAHSIHQASMRSDQPFVALNCAALPENLLESELFGYEAGAFSGAAKGGKIGLFELAHKGTIFLDEIGEIPIALQAKLLRVLQEKEIRRIGSTSVHPIDVRVISATNINIEEQIKEGKFRSDLYYRLNLLDINIPPLRERKEDIQELVDFYLSQFACEMGKSIPTVSPEAARMMKEYEWYGNVRELRNICERLIVLNDTNEISESLLKQLKIFRKMEEKKEQKKAVSTVSEDEVENIYRQLQSKKKKKELAEELGVSRTTLWRMAKKQSEEKQ
ncbi:MAG: sigma 54-interacting transcriptional regulator [Lachnospiraceae bacterium]|nr:sigma 54-interacting transcriptional regulator [Lachnospiraceae bacterium]